MNPDGPVLVPVSIQAGYLAELGLAHRAEHWRRQCAVEKGLMLA
jgi:hypothetical protein